MIGTEYIPANNKLRCLPLLVIILTLISCGGSATREVLQRVSTDNPVITSAERLTIYRNANYTQLTIINPWQGAHDVNQVYHLVKRGSALPDGLDSSMVIFVPLKKIICLSATYISMILALGEENSIAGVSGTDFIFSDKVIRKTEMGNIADVGYETNLNKELILKIDPDLIMMYGIGNESAGYVGKLSELGLKVVFNADYLETDPLKKSEWIKLFGALYCKESMADSIYRSEMNAYYKLKKYINENIADRPKVLLGLPFKDTWYISPGNSYISNLVKDAGGDYIWQNTVSSISMPFGLESVYIRAITADYWLNIGNINTKDEILLVDERLRDLPCFAKGNLYNNNKRSNNKSGNDYWESGSIYPHLILKDIATILHPELFKDGELYFYRKIN